MEIRITLFDKEESAMCLFRGSPSGKAEVRVVTKKAKNGMIVVPFVVDVTNCACAFKHEEGCLNCLECQDRNASNCTRACHKQ